VVAVLLGGGGAFSGMGGASAVSDTSSLKITPILTPTVFAGAFAFGIGISVIFALYPAWRASKLKR